MNLVVPIFDDNVPIRISTKDFLRYHLQQFPRLADKERQDIIANAIDTVYDMFSGVGTIWSHLDQDTWFAKTQTCYRLITAWYIANNYPKFYVGGVSMGAVPLKRKVIGGVDITFSDAAAPAPSGNFRDYLGLLKSNVFGSEAYMMIMSSSRKASLVGVSK